MDADLTDLLDRAAAHDAAVPDPQVLRRRVDRRRRMQTAVVATLIVLTAAVPSAVVLTRDDASVVFDQAVTPTPDPAAPGAAPALSVDVDVSVEGPISEQVSVEVGPLEEYFNAVVGIGSPVTLTFDVTFATTDPAGVDLGAPVAAGEGPTGWRAELSTGGAREVLAGGPPGAPGTVVPAGQVELWLPLEGSLTVQGQTADPLGGVHEMVVTLGDGTDPDGHGALRVILTLTPGAQLTGGRAADPDVIGTMLQVPPVGTARAVLSDSGTPLWIAHTERDGVTVVDARSSFAIRGVIQTVRWCESAQAFNELYGGSRFAPDGTYAFGPATGGLATYGTQPVDDDTVRVISATGGQVRPAQPTDPAVGPWCNEGSLPEGSATPPLPTLDEIPAMAPSALPDTSGLARVEGRLLLDPAGAGHLCVAGPTPWECDDIHAPVDLDATAHPRETEGLAALDAPLVVRVVDGIVVEAWIEGYVPFSRPPGDPTAQTTLVGHVLHIAVGEEVTQDCGQASPCAAVIDVAIVEVRDADGTVITSEVSQRLPTDGTVPDGWIVTGRAADSGALSLRTSSDVLDDGTPINTINVGDLVVVIQEHGTETTVTHVLETD